MSASYHQFVFDVERRAFMGDFEGMYRAELAQGFDSWHQEDLRHFDKRVCLELLADYNFCDVLDIGCGKGAFTQFLKRRNNRVVAVDISATALAVAQTRFPDIEFKLADVTAAEFQATTLAATCTKEGKFDLTVCLETLSYVPQWEQLLGQFAQASRHALIGLYLPENPIGFVKNAKDLVAAFEHHFEIIEAVDLPYRRKTILFGKVKPCPT